MTFESFLALADAGTVPETVHPVLRALAMERRGDWNGAHGVVQEIESPEAAWVHAYLHRREGDLSNASYWYSRAARERPAGDLDREWEDVARELLALLTP